MPFRKVKIDLYVSLSTEEAQLLANLNNKRTSKKVFFQVSMSFMIFLWIFYFGGGLGVSGHHFPYLLFPSIINPRLLYLHRFFLSSDGVESECYFFLLTLHLTTLFIPFITHSPLPPYNSIDFFAGAGVKASVSPFSSILLLLLFLSITLLPPPLSF